MKCFIFPLLLCITFYSYGQPDHSAGLNYLRNVIPPSPNASSLGKYVEWPVSLYNGTVGIDIPVWEVKGRSTSVPISLSYHSSGIKVSEIASSVGLGWALNAGGVITRSVRGLPDEDPAGYLKTRKHFTNPGDLGSVNLDPSGPPSVYYKVAEGMLDTEPDLYYFNALGRSFSFGGIFASHGSLIVGTVTPHPTSNDDNNNIGNKCTRMA